MISIIITSFKEPGTIGRAIESFQNQKEIGDKVEIIVVAPDEETLEVVRKYAKKDKQIKIFKDPGKGKSYALNLLLPKLKGEIIILSDGDVYVSENSVQEILKKFEDEKVGCVSGRPVPQNSRNNLFGYWSHLLCDAGAHEARLKRDKKEKYFECSGYLWAFRNKIIRKFLTDVPEDSVVPLLFYKRGYKIAYASDAKVYVSYPKNLRDFIDQKKRTTKAHIQMSNYYNFNKLPKTKSFKNELFESYRAFLYPGNFKEFFWTVILFPLKLYIWALSYYHVKIIKKYHKDGWTAIKSTK